MTDLPALRVRGVSRDAENDKVLIVAFDRKPTDDELRTFHESLRELTVRAALCFGAQ